jgi:multidrug resistance efflux pump
MTWVTRAKLFLGSIAVLVLVAALTYVYTERESSATSQTATIAADVLPVGTDYGGKIVEQRVEEGDHVVTGDVLFVIDSLQRQLDLQAQADRAAAAAAAEADADGTDADGTDAHEDSSDGGGGTTASAVQAAASGTEAETFSSLWTVTATADGTIAEVPVGPGGYIQAGGTVAHLYEEGSLYVQADFLLSPRDFDRLIAGASVTLRLPDRTQVTGAVKEIEVTTEEGAARAFVEVESETMSTSVPEGITTPGTPVVATVDLRDDGPLAGMRDSASNFLTQIGL